MAEEDIGSIRRQQVQGTQAQVQQRTLNRQTVNKEFRGQVEDTSANAERLVRGIGSFGGEVDTLFKQRNEEKIALDKVTQQQRALAGLAPTDDATTDGLQAYQVVKIRDDVLAVNNDIAEAVRTNPEMTDDEYEEMTRERYLPLLQQYKGNQVMGEALSNRMQESQTQLTQIRMATKRAHREFQNKNLWMESVDTYREAARSPADLHASLQEGGSLYNEGLALGVSPEEQRTRLINQAAMDANNGDGRILRALEQEEWANNDPRIEKAKETFQAWDAQENAVAIGTQWGKIQDSWKNRRSSWAQTEAAIEKLNERFPGTVSAGAVASLRQQQKQVVASDKASNVALMYSLQAMNGDAMPLGLRDDVSDKDKRDAASKFSKLIDDKYAKYVVSGELDDNSARELRLKDKLQWSERHRIVLPEVKSVLKGISASPIDPNQELPTGVATSLETIGLMNDGMKDMYLNEKEQEFYNNYRLFAPEEGSSSAASKAWNSVYRANELSPEEKKTLRDNAARSAKDVGTSFFNGIPFIGSDQKDVPDWYVREATQQLEVEAKARVTSGGMDIEAISEQAKNRFQTTHTQIPSGTFVKGTSSELAAAMSYRDGDAVVEVQPEQVGDVFTSYWNDNKEQLKLESADDDLTDSDIKFEMGPGGRTFIVRDKYGSVISDVEYTEELGRAYSERRVNKAVDQAKDAQERRDATANDPTPTYRPY